MKIKWNKKQQKEYDKYLNEQMKILTNHFSRITLRLINKIYQINSCSIKSKEDKKNGNTSRT